MKSVRPSNGVSLQVHGRRLSLVSGPRAAAPGRLGRHRSLVARAQTSTTARWRSQSRRAGRVSAPRWMPRSPGRSAGTSTDERDRLDRTRIKLSVSHPALPRDRSPSFSRWVPDDRERVVDTAGGAPNREPISRRSSALSGRMCGPLVVRQDEPCWGRTAGPDRWRARARRDRAAREGGSTTGRGPAEGRVLGMLLTSCAIRWRRSSTQLPHSSRCPLPRRNVPGDISARRVA